MILLGADTHKRSHTIAAINATTGEVLGDETVPVGRDGFLAALDWARGLGSERVWAIEDCRHVSGSLERFLIAVGERVVRVPTRLMAGQRRSARVRGKSDSIDAMAVAGDLSDEVCVVVVTDSALVAGKDTDDHQADQGPGERVQEHRAASPGSAGGRC